jgi:hypothetical protein
MLIHVFKFQLRFRQTVGKSRYRRSGADRRILPVTPCFVQNYRLTVEQTTWSPGLIPDITLQAASLAT